MSKPLTAFRFAIAAALAFATAALGYAWVRGVEAVLFPQGDPRAIVAVTASGYLLRCAVAGFAGGMGAFAGWALGEDVERAARALPVAVVIAAAVIALQAVVAP